MVLCSLELGTRFIGAADVDQIACDSFSESNLTVKINPSQFNFAKAVTWLPFQKLL